MSAAKVTLVLFGATGDLAQRKLLPALGAIVEADAHDLSIVGVSRRGVSVKEVFKRHPQLLPRAEMFTMNLSEPDEYLRLKQLLDKDTAGTVLFYLAVPPGAAADIVDFLGEVGLNSSRYRVLFEKPFGYDRISAQEFITRTSRYFDESQLYRIDHYMAKGIAGELLEHHKQAAPQQLWGAHSVKQVVVLATELIGVEGRGQFYEQTGALRDFVQGHLLQILSLVLARPKKGQVLPEIRLEALQSLEPADVSKAVRGQYEGYQEEVGNPGSQVETFVSLELHSTDPEWQGVPLRLITGKALSSKQTSVHIEYLDGSTDVYAEGELLDATSRGLDAYERVLIEAIEGNEDIFTTSDEVLRSWEVLAPVQEAWLMSDESPLLYQPGMSVDDYM